MQYKSSKQMIVIVGIIVLITCAGLGMVSAIEQRDEVSFLRGPYNNAFYSRHNGTYRIGAAIHFAHAKQHDVLLLKPISQHRKTDEEFNAEMVKFIYEPPRIEPPQEYYGPYTAQAMWLILRAIDWTHMHHEQTYDILSEKDIPWNKKKEWTDRAVRYYLEKFDVPRSPAPLDITMRRAGVVMKPYFTVFRNYYPKSNNFFYAAHWWHPAVYEAQMIAGNDEEQEKTVKQVDEVMFSQVLSDRPKRMLLSREMMPRYSRTSPESANIFDNLHMLHGIAYDILAYDGWTTEQKKKELYRVIKAMSYQPGDEKLARKFNEKYPSMDPRVYSNWMKGTEGVMNRIMKEMMTEMMPMMMPKGMSSEMHEKMMVQMKKKLTPGIQKGEIPGSLHDAMMKLMPNMKMMPGTTEPGETSKMMVEAMLKGWQEKYGNMPDIEPMPMNSEPSAPLLPKGQRVGLWHQPERHIAITKRN